MQETKRRSKRGLWLLAVVVALAVMAFVPASAMAAPQQVTPDVNFNGPMGSQGVVWFPSSVGVDVAASGPSAAVVQWAWQVDGSAVAVWPWVTPGPETYNLGSYTEGIHTLQSWFIQNPVPDPLVETPKVSDKFGVDYTSPQFAHVVSLIDGADLYHGEYYDSDDTKFFNPNDATIIADGGVKFSATAWDGGGSGVADFDAFNAPGHKQGWPLAWDDFTWDVTGTIATPTADVTGYMWLDADDVVDNESEAYFHVNFDGVAPETSYDISPDGADTQDGWTNKPVTVTFTAVDGQPNFAQPEVIGGSNLKGNAPLWPTSGVDYTEYIVKTSSTHAVPDFPKLDDNGTKGTSVTISETAPIGPTYVFYRSVDKAVPTPNKEAWKLVMVYFDNIKPDLTNNYPGWWMNSNFDVDFQAADHNSGLAAPGIEWMINPLLAGMPSDRSVGDETNWIHVHFAATADGIWTASYRATDKAGNYAEDSVKIMIDTRAPVTDGASGWINGNVPYVLTSTDQVPGSGVAGVFFRVDQATPWSYSLPTVAPVVETNVTINGDQGSYHTVDFLSVDNARPRYWQPEASVLLGNWELNPPSNFAFVDERLINLSGQAIYKSRTVRLDKVAPVVTVNNPVTSDWQSGPVTINFTGTDDGSGYAYTEWSADGGHVWTKGESATITNNGETTVLFHGVDNVGIKSADQSVTVRVAVTGPTVAAKSATVKKGAKATVKFDVTAITPQASVVISIRKNGHQLMEKRYSMVATNKWVSKSFKVNLPKGKYLIRVSATDLAGNVQTVRGQSTLTVK